MRAHAGRLRRSFPAEMDRIALLQRIRVHIHVSDLADAHVLALQALLRGGESEAINVGTGRGWSVLELIEVARKITRRDIPILFGPRRPGDPPALVSDPR